MTVSVTPKVRAAGCLKLKNCGLVWGDDSTSLVSAQTGSLGCDTSTFSNDTTADACADLPVHPCLAQCKHTDAHSCLGHFTRRHHPAPRTVLCLLLLGALRRFDAHAVGAGMQLKECPLWAETTHCEFAGPGSTQAGARLEQALERRQPALALVPVRRRQLHLRHSSMHSISWGARPRTTRFWRAVCRSIKWMANMLLTPVVIRAGSGA